MSGIKQKILSRFISFVTAAALFVSPAAYAATMSGTKSYSALWSDVVETLETALLNFETNIELDFGSNDVVSDVSDSEVSDSNFEYYEPYYSVNEEGMEEDEIIYSRKIAKIAIDILWEATEHEGTGNPAAGDYMLYCFDSCDYTYEEVDGSYILTFSDISYLVTKQQQAQFALKTAALISANGWDSLSSDYEKVLAVYDYLVTNCKYSPVVASGSDSQFTADGLYTNGSGTFSAFAQFGYYVLNSMNVNAKIVSNGDSHSWIIVYLNGYWYHFDPAYALKTGTASEYGYFLLGSNTVALNSDFDFGWQYLTTSFTGSYNISATDYEVSELSISNESEITVVVGGVYTITAEDSAGRSITFSSSDESVATVSESGDVTGIAVGTAVITVTAGNDTKTLTVYVVEERTVTVSVQDDLTDDFSGGGVYKAGDEVTISVDTDVTGYEFSTWELSSGEITSGDLSYDSLTFIMPDEDVSAVACFDQIEITRITPNVRSVEMAPDETCDISYEIYPSDALDDVTVTVKDESIAWLDDDGTLTALADGATTVVFTSEYSGASISVPVTVATDIYTVEVTIWDEDGDSVTETWEETVGDTVTVSATDISDYGYEFAEWVSTPSLTYTDDTSESDLTISFTMPQQKVTLLATYTEVEAEGISVAASKVKMEVGDTFDLEAEVIPENAPVELTYSSSSSRVASVSSSGVITAIKEGTAKITVSAGDVQKIVSVTVVEEDDDDDDDDDDEYINIIRSSITIDVGDTYTIKYTTNSDDITFSSDDTSIAKVSSKGVITGVSEGDTEITAETEDGEEDTITVYVEDDDEDDDDDDDDDDDNDDDDDDDDDDTLNTASAYLADADYYRANADVIRTSTLASSSSSSSSQTGSYDSGVTATVGSVTVTIYADDDVLSKIATIGVEEVDIDVDMPGYSVGAAYDITLYDADGNEFEPDSDVEVVLSGSGITGYSLSYSVSLIHLSSASSSSYEEMETSISSSGSVSFTTDTFSVYALMIEEDENGDYVAASSANTGDNSHLFLWILAAAGGIFVLVIFAAARKRRKAS